MPDLEVYLQQYFGISGIWLGICAADFLNFLFIIGMNIWLRKKVLSTWS